jgi:uncharacterized protein YndB with AHSA1/START domain
VSTKRRPTETDPETSLLVTRVFDAPREDVFALWANPTYVKEWWHPKGFTTPVFEMDFRVGGQFRYCIRSEGQDRWAKGTYREIVVPERLVLTFQWDSGEHVRIGETLITITFETLGDRTLLTFRQAPFTSAEDRDSHTDGWAQVLDALGAFMSSRRGAAEEA